MARLPVFDDSLLQKVCQILAEGMSGSQMTPLLARVNAPDPGEGGTKWRRLLQALGECQRRHSVGNHACRTELLQDNYFHAVLEATKSVAEKIRVRTGLTRDGHRLVDDAFGQAGGSSPRLAFNSLRTDTERSEHLGLMNLMKGAFSAFRNPTAHEPKTRWVVSEEDALDLLSVLSLLHRRLDNAVLVPRGP